RDSVALTVIELPVGCAVEGYGSGLRLEKRYPDSKPARHFSTIKPQIFVDWHRKTTESRRDLPRRQAARHPLEKTSGGSAFSSRAICRRSGLPPKDRPILRNAIPCRMAAACCNRNDRVDCAKW